MISVKLRLTEHLSWEYTKASGRTIFQKISADTELQYLENRLVRAVRKEQLANAESKRACHKRALQIADELIQQFNHSYDDCSIASIKLP